MFKNSEKKKGEIHGTMSEQVGSWIRNMCRFFSSIFLKLKEKSQNGGLCEYEKQGIGNWNNGTAKHRDIVRRRGDWFRHKNQNTCSFGEWDFIMLCFFFNFLASYSTCRFGWVKWCCSVSISSKRDDVVKSVALLCLESNGDTVIVKSVVLFSLL